VKVKRLKTNESGASAVEFAIVLPLLVLIVFGIIEFGTLLYDKAMITNASREGARAAIVFSNRDLSKDELETPVTDVVTNYCRNYLISYRPTDPIVVAVQKAGNNAGDALTVTVTYVYHWLYFSWFGDLKTLTATTIMRME
jgi:Flp pilus assembly protein TadG